MIRYVFVSRCPITSNSPEPWSGGSSSTFHNAIPLNLHKPTAHTGMIVQHNHRRCILSCTRHKLILHITH